MHATTDAPTDAPAPARTAVPHVLEIIDAPEPLGLAGTSRIVVVDDVPEMAETVAALLGRDGYQVRTARDGREALALAERFRPHGVLLDMDLPGLDGAEVARRLRAAPGGDDLVLVAMTGWRRDDPRLAGAAPVFDHLLRKPFSPLQLRKVLPPVNR